MNKQLRHKPGSFFFATLCFTHLLFADGFCQINLCNMHMAAGGPVQGDGLPHCFNLSVSGFPVPLTPYGTPGQCCIEGIEVNITSLCSGDLTITVTSPAGTSLVLAGQRGGYLTDVYGSSGTGVCSGTGTIFSSFGSGSLTGPPPFISCGPGQGPYFLPDGPPIAGTGVFTGEDINGTWTFCVTVANPSQCGGINNSVNVSSIGIFGNSVSILSIDSVVVNPMDSIICSGDSTVIQAASPGAVSYSWAPVGGLNSTIGSMVTASPAVTTNYTVTATQAGGTTVSSSVTITVAELPQISLNVFDATCGNSNGHVDAITSGGSVPYAFSWNTQPPQMAQSATGLLQGIYTCLLTDANGCTSTASGVVNDLAGGVVSISSVVPPDCFGTPSGSASAVITGGNPPFQYAWNTTPVQTNQVAAGLSAGNYIVLATDANGCTSATSVLLTSPAALNVQSSSVSTFCNGSTGMGNIIVSSGNGGYSFHWNTIPVQTLATATGLGLGTYICIVTDGAGCIDTSQVNIGYYNSGSVVIDSVSGPSCFGSNNGYALASVIGGTPPFSYQWNTIPQQTSLSVSNLSAGSYVVSVSDAAGCTSTASVSVINPDQLVALVNTIPAGCQGANGQAVISVGGGTPPYTYNWNTTPVQTTFTANGLAGGGYSCLVSDAGNCTITITAQVDSMAGGVVSIQGYGNVLCHGSPSGYAQAAITGGKPPYSCFWNTIPVQSGFNAFNLSAGIYMATVTDAAGCTSTASVTINEPQPLVSNSNFTNNYCGAITALAITNVSGGLPPYTFSWNTQPVQTTHIATGLTAGSYTCIVTDAGGCQLIDSFNIENLPVGQAQINVVNPLSCSGSGNGSLAVTIQGGAPPFSYTWNTQPPQTGSVATLLNSGSYIVTVIDGNGCTLTAQAILGDAQPMEVTQSSTSVVCSSADASVAVSVSGGKAPYQYNWNTVPVQTGSTATGLAAGIYSCMVTDAGQCTASITAEVTGSVKPVAAFTYSPVIVSLENPVCTFADASMLASEWYWEFNEPGNQKISVLKNPVHQFMDTGVFCVRLTVKNLDGCIDTAEHCIIVRRGFSVFIPNAFTPDNDGLNDFFGPKVYGVSSEHFSFEIYNRWGDLVFKATSLDHHWDGRLNSGRKRNAGEVFIWKLQLMDLEKNENHAFSGQVVLVKK